MSLTRHRRNQLAVKSQKAAAEQSATTAIDACRLHVRGDGICLAARTWMLIILGAPASMSTTDTCTWYGVTVNLGSFGW